MKLLLAIVQPPKLDVLQRALDQIGIERMTVCDARGYARQRGQNPTYRGHEQKAKLLRKVAVEIVVHDDQLQRAIETISKVAMTAPNGVIGDGKIFVMPIHDAIRMSDEKRGPEAVG